MHASQGYSSDAIGVKIIHSLHICVSGPGGQSAVRPGPAEL